MMQHRTKLSASLEALLPGLRRALATHPRQHGGELRASAQEIRRRLVGLLSRARGGAAPPILHLDLPDRSVQFRTIEEFEFALAGRTEFPAAHLPALAERSAEALERVAAHLWAVERRLRELLTRTPEKAGSLGEELREVELRHFSQDHQWRDLAAALALLGSAYDPYREIALGRYLQYLTSRQEALRTVMMAKQGHLEGSPAAVPGMLETALLEDDQPGRAGDEEAAVPAAFGQLPPGETLVLSLDESGRLMLELSHHPFLLRREPAGLVLEDPVGRRATLGPGPNLVGRHPDSDVVVEGGYCSVSRRHLVLEPMPPDQVRITDLSAHGTSVPAAVLAKALASS